MSTLSVSNIQFTSSNPSITNSAGTVSYLIGDSAGNVTFPNQVSFATSVTNDIPTFNTTSIYEKITINGGFPTGTVPFYVNTQTVYLYTAAGPSANWTFNITADASTTLDSIMTAGQALTVTIFVTNGATGYWPSTFQIDGTTRTVKWQGGTAPSGGNANAIDAWTYSMVKTASNTFTVFGSQTKFS